jgi:hypothetical protein
MELMFSPLRGGSNSKVKRVLSFLFSIYSVTFMSYYLFFGSDGIGHDELEYFHLFVFPDHVVLLHAELIIQV